MKRTPFSSESGRARLGFLRDRRGIVGEELLIISASLLAVLVLGNLADKRTAIRECISDVESAKTSLERRRKEPIALDDLAAMSLRRCLETLDVIAQNSTFLATGGTGIDNAFANIKKALDGLQKCEMNRFTHVVPRPGRDTSNLAFATVPLASDNRTVTISSSLGGPGETKCDRFQCQGAFKYSKEQSLAAAGTTETITLIGTAPGLPSSACVVSVPLKWGDLKKPTVTFFKAVPELIDKDFKENIQFSYTIEGDAETARIDPGGSVAPLEHLVSLPPPKETQPYTLTATGFRPGEFGSRTTTVTVNQPGALTLDPIQSPVTDIHQTVTGTAPVSNPGQRARGLEAARAGGNGTVDIRMNGALQATVAVGDDGHFAANVVLSKVVSQADLSVSDFSNAVASCGPASRGVTVTNSATDVENTITATLTPSTIASALERPAAAASASITVRHAVKLTNFNVNWGGCPGGSPDQPVNTILEAGQSLPVGTVDCGVFSRTDPVFSIGSCFPIVTIGTSLSSLQSTQVWDFATPSPDDPICPEEEGDGDG
jgi:hypothetical protein